MSDPQALLRSAEALEKAGRLAEAEAAYLRVLAIRPDLPDTWYNLARLQRRAGRFDAALASYQQALDRGVSEPEEVHLNRSVIYSDCLRQDEAAERELQAALALNRNYVPALLNLANLREDFGKQAEARALYEKILELQPRCYIALARYVGLQKVTQANDPLIARLRAGIADSSASAADRADLGFALGKALDSGGAWDAAFAAYAAANRDSRQSAAPRTAVYDRRAHERLIDEIVAAFQPGQPNALRLPHSVRPLFICGMFRSGSTLAEQGSAECSAPTPLRASAVHLRNVPLRLDARGTDPGRALASCGRRRARIPAVAGAFRAGALPCDDGDGVAGKTR